MRIRQLLQSMLRAAAIFGVACTLFSCASRATNNSLPPDFARALEWLPPNSESLVATLQPFRLGNPAKDSWAGLEKVFFSSLAEKNDAARFPGLEGLPVLWAVAAKRKQEIRSRGRMVELGVHRYESVAISKFAGPIPPGLRMQMAAELQPVMTHGIEVFRSKTGRWALIIPAPDTLVFMTMLTDNDLIIDDVAIRLAAQNVSDRLFPFDQAPWTLVQVDKTYWGIRKAMPSAPGRPYDAVGRDWVLFSHDRGEPGTAMLRSVLSAGAEPKSLQAAAEYQQASTSFGFTVSQKAGPGYVDTLVKCLPKTGNGCIGFLPFMVEAFGIMVWI